MTSIQIIVLFYIYIAINIITKNVLFKTFNIKPYQQLL